jgi:hypothetical protein
LSRRPFRKPLRLLVPAAVLGAVVLVPGVAWAGDSTGDDPLGTVTAPLQDALGGGTATGATGDGTPELPADTPIPCVTPGVPPGCTPADGGEPATPPGGLPDDSALRDAFIEGLGKLGISADCVNGVFDGFENLLEALQNQDPEQLPALVDELVSALQNQDPTAFADYLQNNDVGQALQGLATTLQKECMPAPPTSEGSHNPPPPPAAAQPVVPAAQPAAPPAAAPAAQPVSYPGYAPTGGIPEESSSPVPLAVLGGVVLLSGVGAAGYRMSSRAARSRG